MTLIKTDNGQKEEEEKWPVVLGKAAVEVLNIETFSPLL